MVIGGKNGFVLQQLLNSRRSAEVVSAFNSNLRYFGASQEMEAPNDIEAVCRLCRVPGHELSIQKLQGKRRVFQDEICSGIRTTVDSFEIKKVEVS